MRVYVICCAALFAGSAFGGCAVDDRALRGLTLTIIPSAGESGQGALGEAGAASSGGGGSVATENGGSAGTTEAGAPNAGAAGGASSRGGAGGTGAVGGDGGMAGAPPPPRCPDLDDDGVADCDETLANNGAFDSDVEHWSADSDIELGWRAGDALGRDDSGALAATCDLELDQDGSKLLGVVQCLPVDGGGVYHFGAQVAVLDDATATTRGGLQLLLYDAPSCAGRVVDNQTAPNLNSSPDWKPVSLTYLTPSSAKSVAVRLLVIKPFRLPPVTVLFDNVLARAED